MNGQHLKAFFWLRWRLIVNQSRRAGALNAVLMMIATIGAVATAVPLFIASFMLGLYLIPESTPMDLMYTWDALIVGFLFFWVLSVVVELQRTEPLSLSKFLHLPVSVDGAFLINYLSSLLRLTLIVFGPVMLGFCLALIITRGILLLPVLPLLAAFLLMITALTYQLQGWLGALMENPRRRRTVVMAISAIVILVSQAPNLLSFLASERGQTQADPNAAMKQELVKLDRARQAGKIDSDAHLRGYEEAVRKHNRATEQAERERADHGERTARLVNLVLPVGWLPLGVVSAAEGDVRPSLLALLGMTLIGTASLWRAYRTTIRQYQGQSTSRKARPAPAAAPPARPEAGRPAARSPSSWLVGAGFGHRARGLVLSDAGARGEDDVIDTGDPDSHLRLHAVAVAARCAGADPAAGRDRNDALHTPGHAATDGQPVRLRPRRLSCVRAQCGARRDILLGKNLAFAPLALGMALILLAFLQVFCPLRLDHLLAMFPQYLSMYLLTCLVTNLLSIFAPVPVAAGSLKASSPKLSTVLLQLAMVFFLIPLTQGPTLLPLGIEALSRYLGWTAAAPICLMLTLAECAIVVVLYRFELEWQGRVLQAREQRILECVTSRAP